MLRERATSSALRFSTRRRTQFDHEMHAIEKQLSGGTLQHAPVTDRNHTYPCYPPSGVAPFPVA